MTDMRLRPIYLFSFFLVAFLAINTFAGDFASVKFIGFSNDGRYFAFEEYGMQDASGFPYSTIYFVDTVKNAMAAPPVQILIKSETSSERAARSRSAAGAAKTLAKLKIVSGNTGNLVVSHPMTDQTFDDGSDDKKTNLVKFAEQVQSMHREGDFELLLKPIPIKTKECEPYEMDTFIFEMSLKDNVENVFNKTLQKDTTLPKSRGCAQSYRIQDVYLYKEFIAVLINVFTPGFEGPDMRFMAVSGKLR